VRKVQIERRSTHESSLGLPQSCCSAVTVHIRVCRWRTFSVRPCAGVHGSSGAPHSAATQPAASTRCNLQRSSSLTMPAQTSSRLCINGTRGPVPQCWSTDPASSLGAHAACCRVQRQRRAAAPRRKCQGHVCRRASSGARAHCRSDTTAQLCFLTAAGVDDKRNTRHDPPSHAGAPQLSGVYNQGSSLCSNSAANAPLHHPHSNNYDVLGHGGVCKLPTWTPWCPAYRESVTVVLIDREHARPALESIGRPVAV
jgi:hypothetical protein